MKIGFITKRVEYTHSTPVLDEIFIRLFKRGVRVEHIIPEEDPFDLLSRQRDCDLYVLKPGIELGLSLAGMLAAEGLPIINDYHACALTHDKLRTTVQLGQAGLPVPRSFVTGNIPQVIEELNGRSVIIKPHRGSYGDGIHIVHRGDPVPMTAKGGFFVQELLPSPGYDIKLYVIGQEVFCIKRPFPAHNYEEKLGQAYPLNDELHRLALDTGKTLGLEIYGLDVIETPDGYAIVDVNYFPGFIGIPAAPDLIAMRLLERVFELQHGSYNKRDMQASLM